MKLRVVLLLSFLVIATGIHLEAYPYDQLRKLLLEYFRDVNAIVHDKFKDTCLIWSEDQYLPKNDENVVVDIYGTNIFINVHVFVTPHQFWPETCPRSKTIEEVITRRIEISQRYNETATLFAKGLSKKCNVTVKFLDPREYGTVYSDDPYLPEAVFDLGDDYIYVNVLTSIRN